MTSAAALLLPVSLPAKSLETAPRRTLSLFNTHTGESLHQIVYWEQGRYLQQPLRELDYLLRDHRTGDIKTIDPTLFDLLHALHCELPAAKPFEVISGYRSPATNHMLRSRSGGVAKNSLHLTGQAIDIRLPGYPLVKLRKIAASLKGGGVGFYPRSNFVHIDTGRVRYW